ncbi:putative nucleic acid-binding Zn-ribbon protein [Desulfohalotomaculum tongense]|nr:C4-type zinc ribbon domain-containing protein [Desulforadius tongensis]MBM7855766.1 putative nucleic acid-binding Zn-ribbon protein [Desulforadius tongensis]
MNNIKRLWHIQMLELEEQKKNKILKANNILNDLLSKKVEIEIKQQEFKRLKEKYKLIKKEIDKINNEVMEEKVQISKLDNKLYNCFAYNQREIEAVQRRLHSLKKRVNDFENKELFLMEQQETVKNKLTGLSRLLKKKIGDFQQLREQYYLQQDKTKRELKELQKNKQKLYTEVDPEIMKLYNNMRRRFKNPVARAENGICGGCHMTLTTVTQKKLAAAGEQVKCDNCGRLIFME